MHPQTLRKYERAGFVDPHRAGALRLYSEEDIVRLRLIKHFVENLGLNLAGVELTLRVVNDLLALRASLKEKNDESSLESLRHVDHILENRYCIRIVQNEAPSTERPEQGDESSTSAFDISGTEAVQFTGAGTQAG
jgi:MerR family transcriptional regulator/heat shock protein HspR